MGICSRCCKAFVGLFSKNSKSSKERKKVVMRGQGRTFKHPKKSGLSPKGVRMQSAARRSRGESWSNSPKNSLEIPKLVDDNRHSAENGEVRLHPMLSDKVGDDEHHSIFKADAGVDKM